MRTANRFEKGSGCFICSVCSKRTRATGRGDNEFAGLCERCYDMAGDENSVTDGEMTTEEFEKKWGSSPFTKPEVSNSAASTTEENEMSATKTAAGPKSMTELFDLNKISKETKATKKPVAKSGAEKGERIAVNPVLNGKPTKEFEPPFDAGGGILVTVEKVKKPVAKTNPNVKEKKVEILNKKPAEMNKREKTEAIRKLRNEMRSIMTLPHARVLRVLARAKGPISRGEISKRNGNKTGVVVGRAIGYSDPEKRAEFKLTKDGKVAGTPLLESKYVTEKELNVDGEMSLVVEITKSGRAALEKYLDVYERYTKLVTGKATREFPEMRDSFNNE